MCVSPFIHHVCYNETVFIRCSLSELELTRDDLLIQLYQSSEAFVDRNTVEFTTSVSSYYMYVRFIMSAVFTPLL